jgi:chromate reductase, NAD(P)H dehydrogenase (quinone)
MKTVAVLVGSLGEKSINLNFTKALERLADSRLKFDYLDLGSLPHYNNDLWDNPPAAVTRFKAQVEAADAALFVTPEFNRSFPGVLKNAIDWGSRPWGHSSWAGKPASIVGTTPGVIGTAAAQSQLRTILPVLEMVLMGQPEVYFQAKPGLIDEHFEITDEQTRAFLDGYIARFADWIDRHGQTHAEAIAAE